MKCSQRLHMFSLVSLLSLTPLPVRTARRVTHRGNAKADQAASRLLSASVHTRVRCQSEIQSDNLHDQSRARPAPRTQTQHLENMLAPHMRVTSLGRCEQLTGALCAFFWSCRRHATGFLTARDLKAATSCGDEPCYAWKLGQVAYSWIASKLVSNPRT